VTRAVHPDTAAALDAYLTDRAATAGVEVDQLTGPLLVTASGARLDQPALFRLVRLLARAVQLPAWRQLSPHSLRYSFATIYLDHGGMGQALRLIFTRGQGGLVHSDLDVL
jgi:integrase/recombinase XerD